MGIQPPARLVADDANRTRLMAAANGPRLSQWTDPKRILGESKLRETTMTKLLDSALETIHGHETISEFLERVCEIRVRRESCTGGRAWFEPVVMTPAVACDLSQYAFDAGYGEQPEPVSGQEYTFRACGNHPMTPVGGFDFVATCWREGDVAYFEIDWRD